MSELLKNEAASIGGNAIGTAATSSRMMPQTTTKKAPPLETELDCLAAVELAERRDERDSYERHHRHLQQPDEGVTDDLQ
jgi:hypothetical protein